MTESAVWEELARAEGGMSAPFVPRPALERALADALEESACVLLLGEAGFGKTRLADHVLRDSRYLTVSCRDLMTPTARGAVAALLAQLDPPPLQLVRLLNGTTAGEGEATDEQMLLRAAGHHLAGLLPPVAVLIDDAEVLSDAEATRLTTCVAASQGHWIIGSRRPLDGLEAVSVLVPALEPSEANELLDELLPNATPQLRETVLRRAGDSPLFLEQCVRLLTESGVVTLAATGARTVSPERLHDIPTSMRVFVAERLALLGERERQALGVAAVLGPQPELPLLEFLAREDRSILDELLAKGLLRRSTDSTGQPSVRFGHALVREVAYDTMPRDQRVALHLAAAEWYAVLPVSQVLESQAYHLEAAAQLGDPDCSLVQRTVDAMVLFARSIEEERTQTSREVLTRARLLAERRPECAPDPLALELAWASVNVTVGREEVAAEAARTGLALAHERRDTRATAEAHLQLARALRYVDADASAHLDAAQTAYERIEDAGGAARVEVERGALAQHDKGITQYVQHLELAYALAMRTADSRLQAMCAQHLAMHHGFALGRAGFELWAERAQDVSRRDDLGLQPRLDLTVATLAMFELDPQRGLALGQRALESGRNLGLLHTYANALVVTFDLLVLSGALDDAMVLLPEGREFCSGRPTPWPTLQMDLVEARLRSRRGELAEATRLLQGVADHELSAQRVLRRDLAEARAWVALERGRFGEARALAVEAVAVDEEMDERCAPMRPRLVELVASVAAGDTVALGTIAALRAQARETGLTTIAQLATRWLYVDELTRGWTVDLHGVEPCDVIECRALDLEIEALSSRRWDLLRDAAAVWSELGTTVWRARALLWYSELTGQAAPQADELLITLNAPDGLAETLRAQVRGLRAGS